MYRIIEKMKIKKEKNKIIIEIPFFSKRINPYMLDANGEPEDVGEHPTLVGVIEKDEYGNEELGFAKTIDMDYKNKGDQETGIMIHYWDGDEKDFIKLCKELEIDVIKYPECSKCGKSIFGSFTYGEKGPECWECENKKIEKKERIKELLRGAMITQNEINKGVFNEVGINYITEELAKEILKIC